MSYMRSEFLSQAADAGRKSAQRPPEPFERLEMVTGSAGENSQAVALTASQMAVAEQNERAGRTTMNGGGPIRNGSLGGKVVGSPEQSSLQLPAVAQGSRVYQMASKPGAPGAPVASALMQELKKDERSDKTYLLLGLLGMVAIVFLSRR